MCLRVCAQGEEAKKIVLSSRLIVSPSQAKVWLNEFLVLKVNLLSERRFFCFLIEFVFNTLGVELSLNFDPIKDDPELELDIICLSN